MDEIYAKYPAEVNCYKGLRYFRNINARIEVERYEGYYGDDPNSVWYEEWFHWMKDPSHWRRQMETRPRRARERQLLTKLRKGELDADDVVFPEDRKPHIYYW